MWSLMMAPNSSYEMVGDEIKFDVDELVREIKE